MCICILSFGVLSFVEICKVLIVCPKRQFLQGAWYITPV